MVLVFNSVALVLFIVSMSGCNCEEADQNDAQSNETAQANQTSFDDPFVRLMSAASIEEALAMNILYKDNHIATAADLGAVINSTSGKLMVSGDHAFAVPDGCYPRATNVEINVLGLSATSRLYPRCIKVERCTGCCGMSDVKCVPQYKEREIYNFVEIAIGGSGLSVVGNYPVEVEQHLSCQCVCSLSREICGPNKIYNPLSCSCDCPKDIRCFPPKMYNPSTCTCLCASVHECCSGGTDCSFEFNHDTCECDVARLQISANVNQSSVDEYVQNQQAANAGGSSSSNSSNGSNALSSNNNGSQQAPQDTTTTTTTTTTSTTTTEAACDVVSCPGNFQLDQVNCACVLRSTGRRGRGRG